MSGEKHIYICLEVNVKCNLTFLILAARSIFSLMEVRVLPNIINDLLGDRIEHIKFQLLGYQSVGQPDRQMDSCIKRRAERSKCLTAQDSKILYLSKRAANKNTHTLHHLHTEKQSKESLN